MTEPSAAPPGRVSARVRVDLQIVAFGDDLMRMFDDKGDTLVTAVRGDNGAWTISGGILDDVTAATRDLAITAMNERAVALRPGRGLSVQVPYGLRETP